MDEMSCRAIRAKSDNKYFDDFALENKKFILACAYKALHHYVTEHDDEWSIALIAFHEAVQEYDETKGPFGAFASLVIRRRLLDEYRRESDREKEVSVSPDVFTGEYREDENGSISEMGVVTALRHSEKEDYERCRGRYTMQDEIEAVQLLLKEYGFSFFDLTECSPRSQKTKKACADAVCCLLEDQELFRKMREAHILPIREICEQTHMNRKLLERHRRYIIAAAEILNGEYPLLAEYMAYIKRSLKT